MEDNKVKAGNVAFGICVIIIAILLVLIVFIFYNSSKERIALQDQISELEKSIEENGENIGETKNENLENKETIVLYQGMKIEPIPGSTFCYEMEDNLEDYKTKFYNYENGEYKGETEKRRIS